MKMRLHPGLLSVIVSLSLLAACAGGPVEKSAPAAADKSSAGTGLDPLWLSDSRMNPYDMPLIIPALPEPDTVQSPATARALSAPTDVPAESGVPVESGHRPQPVAAAVAAALPEPGIPAVSKKPAAAATAPAAVAAKPQTASKPSAAAKPASEAKKQEAKKEEIPVPVFASTPSSSETAVEAAREPDIAQHIVVELGERVEVPLEGTGWTYLGEKDGRDGVLYESRQYNDTGLVFVLNPTKTGSYILRFQKQDALRGRSYEEYVGLTVNPKSAKAPAAAQAGAQSGGAAQSAGAAAAQSGATGTGAAAGPVTAAGATGTGAAAGQGVAAAGSVTAAGAAGDTGSASGQSSQSSASAGTASDAGTAAPLNFPPDSPEGLIQTAKNNLSSGKIAEAIAALDRFLALYPAGMDEVYYLYGYAYEQNGPYRDIRKAYNYYKKVSDDYPESEFWSRAKDRASYIERHYFEIR